jgi:hypothetical protein
MENPKGAFIKPQREFCMLLRLCYQEWTRYNTKGKIPHCGDGVK